LDGEDLRGQPLSERRGELSRLIGTNDTSPLQFSQEFTGDAVAFFRACAEKGPEGVVSKLATSRYRSGRSKTWLRTKCFTESEFMLVGPDRGRKTGGERALLAKAEHNEHLCWRRLLLVGQRGTRDTRYQSRKLSSGAADDIMGAEPEGTVGQARTHSKGDAPSWRRSSAHATVKAIS
jgi:ATP-dependent DNA ligase